MLVISLRMQQGTSKLSANIGDHIYWIYNKSGKRFGELKSVSCLTKCFHIYFMNALLVCIPFSYRIYEFERRLEDIHFKALNSFCLEI